jgi:hypothetical protein
MVAAVNPQMRYPDMGKHQIIAEKIRILRRLRYLMHLEILLLLEQDDANDDDVRRGVPQEDAPLVFEPALAPSIQPAAAVPSAMRDVPAGRHR